MGLLGGAARCRNPRRSFRLPRGVAVCLCLVALSTPGSSADVNEVIDKGIQYLLGQVEETQLGEHQVGQLALEVYALVVAGVPTSHPTIRKAFEVLHKRAIGTNHTYTISCYVFALDAAIAQVEHDLLIFQPASKRKAFADDPRIGKEYRPHLEKAVQAIVRLQNKSGGWRYTTAQDFDNSNVQFAVLALGVGAKRRVAIHPDVWNGVIDHFLKWQEPEGPEIAARVVLRKEKSAERHKVTLKSKDGRKITGGSGSKGGAGDKDEKEGGGRTVVEEGGAEAPEVGLEGITVRQRGWPYTPETGYTWNMTCAGLSSMILARDTLRAGLRGERLEAVNKAIRDGYGWLMGHWTPTASFYGIYSLEKVADLGGVEKFDGHDWYLEVSKHLTEKQEAAGSWPGGGGAGENARVATAFALLVLNRATTLLTMSPASFIVVSGRSSSGNDIADRAWVYIPKLDSCLHFPTLMRTIRLRPTGELIGFLRNIVDNYPAEWKGELIPELLATRKALPSKAAHKTMDGYLEEITGLRTKDVQGYAEWHRRWKRVNEIGRERKASDPAELLALYDESKDNLVLRKSVCWALIQCRIRAALPLFLRDLEHEDSRFRASAYDSLKAFFVDLPPEFRADAAESVRKGQVEKIRVWYEKQSQV